MRPVNLAAIYYDPRINDLALVGGHATVRVLHEELHRDHASIFIIASVQRKTVP